MRTRTGKSVTAAVGGRCAPSGVVSKVIVPACFHPVNALSAAAALPGPTARSRPHTNTDRRGRPGGGTMRTPLVGLYSRATWQRGAGEGRAATHNARKE